MQFFSAPIARSLLFSGVALALAVFAFQQHRGGQAQRQADWVEAEEDRYFSALCFDVLTVDKVRLSDPKGSVELRLKDRWRHADGQPVEDAKLQIILAQLRGLQVEKIEPRPKDDALGLSIPTQTLEVSSSLNDKTCRLSLGQKHPTKPLYVLRRTDGQDDLVGWAKLKPSGGQLIDLNELAAVTILPLRAGQIDGLSIQPQVGNSPYQIRRARGLFVLTKAGDEQRADKELVEILLTKLVGLKGALEPSKTQLSDPDLVVVVGHAPLSTRLEFYRQNEALLIATQGFVFSAKEPDLSWLLRSAEAWRDRQLIHYDRGQTHSVEIHDGSGRVFSYRRELGSGGAVDRWFQGERQIKEAHRLAGLQWDLHQLRGASIVDELDALECGALCSRVVVRDAKKRTLVDLSLDRQGSEVLARAGKSLVMRIEASQIAHWPFEQLN